VQLSLNKKEGTKYKSTKLSLFDGMRHLRLSVSGGRSSSSCSSLLIRVSHDISLVEQLGNKENLKITKKVMIKNACKRSKNKINGKNKKMRKKDMPMKDDIVNTALPIFLLFWEGTKVRRQRGNN
jgi:hypothetical protein